MQGDLQSLLQQNLRGLENPDPIGWWPLATGWWFLIILVIAIMVVGAYFLVRNHQRNKYRKEALKLLKKDSTISHDIATLKAYKAIQNEIIKNNKTHITVITIYY